MKKILTIIFASISITGIYAQNQGLIQSTQFPANTYMLNPAYAGAEEYTSIQSAYKRNWVGLVPGPQTIYVSAHTRLQSEGKIDVKREVKKDTADPTNYSLPLRGRSLERYKLRAKAASDSFKIEQMQDELEYQKKVAEAREQLKFRPYHGVGVHVINEQTGPLARTGFNASYAYHISLTKKIRWSFGASIGLGSHASSELWLREQEVLFTNNTPKGNITPDFNLGTYLYHEKFYLGFSAISLIPAKAYENSPDNNMKPIFIGTGGYKIALNDDLALTPGLLVRYFNGSVGFDLNARVNYKTLWGGFTYRNQDAIAAMVGINLGKVFDISYSYDFTLSAINAFTRGGGHEIMIGYRLQRKNGSLTSRLFN